MCDENITRRHPLFDYLFVFLFAFKYFPFYRGWLRYKIIISKIQIKNKLIKCFFYVIYIGKWNDITGGYNKNKNVKQLYDNTRAILNKIYQNKTNIYLFVEGNEREGHHSTKYVCIKKKTKINKKKYLYVTWQHQFIFIMYIKTHVIYFFK